MPSKLLKWPLTAIRLSHCKVVDNVIFLAELVITKRIVSRFGNIVGRVYPPPLIFIKFKWDMHVSPSLQGPLTCRLSRTLSETEGMGHCMDDLNLSISALDL